MRSCWPLIRGSRRSEGKLSRWEAASPCLPEKQVQRELSGFNARQWGARQGALWARVKFECVNRGGEEDRREVEGEIKGNVLCVQKSLLYTRVKENCGNERLNPFQDIAQWWKSLMLCLYRSDKGF